MSVSQCEVCCLLTSPAEFQQLSAAAGWECGGLLAVCVGSVFKVDLVCSGFDHVVMSRSEKSSLETQRQDWM